VLWLNTKTPMAETVCFAYAVASACACAAHRSKGIKMSITKLQGIKGAGGQGGRGVAIDLCLSCTPRWVGE
jgi:hypothetical protein